MISPVEESPVLERAQGDAAAPLLSSQSAEDQPAAEKGTQGPNKGIHADAGPTPYLLETLSDASLSKYLADMKKPPDPGTSKPRVETDDAEACRTCGIASRMFARGREGTGTEATALCLDCGGQLHWACAMLDGNNWLPRAPGHPTSVICADCLLRMRRDGRPQLTVHKTARELPETDRTVFLEAFLARSVQEEVSRAAAEQRIPEEQVPQPRGSLHVREVQSRRNPGHPSPLLDAAFPDEFTRPGSYLERTTLVFQQDGDDDLPVILFGLITNESDQSTAPPHQGWGEISYVESTRHLDLHPPPPAAATANEFEGSPGAGRPRSRSSSVGVREHHTRRSKRKRSIRGHEGEEQEVGRQGVLGVAACSAFLASACPSPAAEPGEAEGERDGTQKQQHQEEHQEVEHQEQQQQQQQVTMSTVVAGALLTGQLAWWSRSGCRRVSLWSWPPGDGRAYMFLGPTRPTAMDRSKLLAWHRNWLNRAKASPSSVVASVSDGLPGQEWDLQGMPRFRGQWWLRRVEQMLARKNPPATLQLLKKRLVKKAKDERQTGHFLRIELHRSDNENHASPDSAGGGGGGGAEGERLNAACPDREALLALQCSLGLSFQTRRLAVYSTAVLISRLHYGLEQGGAVAAAGPQGASEAAAAAAAAAAAPQGASEAAAAAGPQGASEAAAAAAASAAPQGASEAAAAEAPQGASEAAAAAAAAAAPQGASEAAAALALAPQGASEAAAAAAVAPQGASEAAAAAAAAGGGSGPTQ